VGHGKRRPCFHPSTALGLRLSLDRWLASIGNIKLVLLSRFLSCLNLIYFSVWNVVVELVALKSLAPGHKLAPFPGLFEKHGAAHLIEHLDGGFERAHNESLALFNLDKVAEIPRELLRKIEVVLHVLGVYILVIEDAVEDPGVENARIATNLHIIVGTVLELNALVVPVLEVFDHEDVSDRDLLALPIPGLHDEFGAAGHQEQARQHAPIHVKQRLVSLVEHVVCEEGRQQNSRVRHD